MSIANPQSFVLLLLLIPLAKPLLKGIGKGHKVLRITLIFLIVFAIADPWLDFREEGVDVIVIKDKSASMGIKGEETINELSSLLNDSKGEHDRIAMISFGESATVEKTLSKISESGATMQSINPNGSNLTSALNMANAITSKHRFSRILILSDGNFTGKNPAEETNLKNQIWYRQCGPTSFDDIAAGNISVPSEVLPGTGFVLRYEVYSPLPLEAKIVLQRNRKMIVNEQVALQTGWNTFFVRDIADSPKIFEYTLTVDNPNDRRTENNTSTSLLRVVAPSKVLHVTENTAEGIISSTLNAANIPFDSREPFGNIFNPALLSPYKVVIIENTHYDHIGRQNALSLSEAVNAGVVSLLVTGGKNSFGNGGYHKSPIDEILPVTMKLREEQRKAMMALVIVADRSGSMAMTVQGGKTKMHLANTAAAESTRLLSAYDQISYIAVDSSAHTVVPLSKADDTSQLVDTIMHVESMGGGIFVRTALEAAIKEIEKSKLLTKHIILFSDASDSEEQEGCVELAAEMVKNKISLSVIGLGSRKDSDAAFLIELAGAAHGEIFFTNKAEELPRIFSQEVIRVARIGFVEEITNTKAMPDILSLGAGLTNNLPQLNGYNLNSLREGSLLMMRTTDDYKAPIVAMRRKGKAATAAITAEVDAKERIFSKWQKTPELIVSITKNLASSYKTANAKAFSKASRGIASVRLELSKLLASQVRNKELAIKLLTPNGEKTEKIPLNWSGLNELKASFKLKKPGHYLPVIDLGEYGIVKAPALSLSYSSEFMPAKNIDGQKVLKNLAEITGGQELIHADNIFNVSEAEQSKFYKSLRNYILFICLILLLIEIAEKRLHVFSNIQQ